MSHFSLPADCTVGHVAKLKAVLQPAIESDDATIVVSGADVERCDASLLQLLLALGTRLSHSNRHLEIAQPSSALSECVALLGLADVLLPEVHG
jgi:ABC-type transporter Mla MlaB component